MEPRLAADLGHVRLHTGGRAAQSARDLQAHAYTVGQDIVFAAGRFAPTTLVGRELLAHELAHTVQQRGATGAPPDTDRQSVHEQTARLAAHRIASGHRSEVTLPSAGIGLSMSADDERAKAVAEAEALLARMDADDQETARKESEEEDNRRKALAERVRPTTSLVKHHPARGAVSD
jgi:hypothetical protein